MIEEDAGNGGEELTPLTFSKLLRGIPMVEMLLNVPFDGIYITDRSRRIIFWNKGAENITGFSAREVMGHCCAENILNHIDGKGRAICKGGCPLSRCMDERKPNRAIIYPLNKKGFHFPALTHVTPLQDHEMRVVGAIEVFRDISQEEDLRLLQKKFNSIIKKYVSNATFNEALLQASTSRETLAELIDRTILFLDVVDFTGFSEVENPAEVARSLNVMFSLCELQVRECGGDIDKYIGDAAMAVFDDANDAVRAAIRIQEFIRQMNEGRLKESKRPLLVRVGINSGMVIHGEVGSPTRKELTVIGDPVNTASRVQAMAKPGMIYITESTLSRLRHPQDFRHVGEVLLKGKKESVRVFEYHGRINMEMSE